MNDVSSSYIHDEIHSLNFLWDLPWMWKKEALFLHALGIPKNFPYHFAIQEANVPIMWYACGQ